MKKPNVMNAALHITSSNLFTMYGSPKIPDLFYLSISCNISHKTFQIHTVNSQTEPSLYLKLTIIRDRPLNLISPVFY